MEYIIKYLTEKYKPEGIICYGSFSDGTNDEKSDFDALVIAEGKEQGHDGSTVNGVLLDVFLNSPEYIKKGPSPESYLQLYDGKILLDKNGLCAQLLKSVREYVDEKAGKSAEELEQEVGWCEKMLRRAIRGDAEGCYRLHWLLVDSLEIYFDITGKFYFGPKKIAAPYGKREHGGKFALFRSDIHRQNRKSGEMDSLSALAFDAGALRKLLLKFPVKMNLSA